MQSGSINCARTYCNITSIFSLITFAYSILSLCNSVHSLFHAQVPSCQNRFKLKLIFCKHQYWHGLLAPIKSGSLETQAKREGKRKLCQACSCLSSSTRLVSLFQIVNLLPFEWSSPSFMLRWARVWIIVRTSQMSALCFRGRGRMRKQGNTGWMVVAGAWLILVTWHITHQTCCSLCLSQAHLSMFT